MTDSLNTDLTIDGAASSKKKVNASDGLYLNAVRVDWPHQQGNIYTIYRNTLEAEPGDRIRAKIKTPQISDRRVDAGVLYYYTVFLNSPNSSIIEIGKDSGFKKVQKYAVEGEELIAGTQDSGNFNFGIDSLRILSSNIEAGDKIAFEYRIPNTTAYPLRDVSLKFWLSTNQVIDDADKLLLTKYLEPLPKDESIAEELRAYILSTTPPGDYYFIGETTFGGVSISHIAKPITIQ